MNPILQSKVELFKKALDGECWYIVKQPTDFANLCYLVSFLKKYQETTLGVSLDQFISKEIARINKEKGLTISDNYRALRVAAFFGLIKMTNAQYQNAIITDVYYEIEELCHGSFENKAIYQSVIDRQLEKMYVSTTTDEQYKALRKDYELYPVMLLYKVILEIGHATGDYAISMDEYRYFVATTKKYEDFLNTLIEIHLFRGDKSNIDSFSEFRSKFDNRMIQAIRQLSTLHATTTEVRIKDEYLSMVSAKVHSFEKDPLVYTGAGYLDFLCSTKSLFDNCDGINQEKQRISRDGDNILLYGVPGCGKSFTIKNEYCDDETRMERVVFHPDYTYSDFVGQILPQNINGHITYPFIPGPFTRIMRRAVQDNANDYYLIIEELNRGNAPAIFGEVFQLLDRVNSESEYGINNADIANEVYGDPAHLVRVPSNLFILATMNTADQNVFTLDTAFKRRWRMRSIANDISKCTYANNPICDTNIKWGEFLTTINNLIIELGEGNIGSEDKRLGAFFLKPHEVSDPEMFAQKVLMYLWNDAFKYDHESVFKSEYKTLEQLISGFASVKFGVFAENIQFDSDSNDGKDVEMANSVTVEQYLTGKSAVATTMYNALIKQVDQTGIAYTLGAVANYISIKTHSGRNVAELLLQKETIKVRIKEPLDPQLKIGYRLPETYKWSKNYEILVDTTTDMFDVANAIADSFRQFNGE